MATFTEEEFIELELLRDQEIDALVENELLPSQERWNLELRDGFTFSYPEVVVEITTGHPYPVGLPTYQVVNRTMPAAVVDKLRIELREIMEWDSRVNTLENWIARTTLDDLACFEFEMIVLHIAAKTHAQVQAYRAHLEEIKAPTQSLDNLGQSFTGADCDVNLSSIEGRSPVQELFEQKLEAISAEIPDDYRIFHVETVIRDDLHANFRARQRCIREDLNGKHVDTLRRSVHYKVRRPLLGRDGEKTLMVDHLIRPRLTFHGTTRESVPSIVRHGFLLPGERNPVTKQPHGVRCGNTYGRGIYSSPSLTYSLSYSPSSRAAPNARQYAGIKIIVCATVMGITELMKRTDNRQMINQPVLGAHSHADCNQLEYIVFNRAQILPCYVIHLLDVSNTEIPLIPTIWTNAQKLQSNKKLNPDILTPGDKQRAKEAIIGRAAKYFPYGYRPAVGTSFVVEEVGEVDEDEEDYGMYQEDRTDEVKDGLNGGGNFWGWDDEDNDEGKSRDEYFVARRLK